MGIRKKKRFQKRNLKRFTISAAATTVLTLHAELASAASCPTLITGTALANIVCDFDGGTGSSVTVANGGEVGGITMNGYDPLTSHITINAGGVVSNTTSAGISVNNSTLTNGLINNGTINTANTTGISIVSGSVVAGISNTGTISAGATGIRIANSNTINGSITNSGTISAGGVNNGIAIVSGNTISGGITNTGIIQATGAGNGIIIRDSTISGNISNSGTITAAQTGISVLNSGVIQGNISNSGSIVATASNGIRVSNASQVNGDISNTGSITAGNIGINVYSATTIGGAISNTGTINADQTGIAVNSTSTVTGGISNSGTIQGDTNAINVSAGSTVSDIDILGQSARIIGNVIAASSDFNITSGATFTSEGTFNVDNFNIASNALFNMDNTITANAVNNAGTLAVDNTQTITGNYTQNTGGVLQVGISSSSNYGKLTVTGAANLSASGAINIQVAPSTTLHTGDVFNIISAATFTAPTGGYTVTSDSFLWSFTAATLLDPGVNLTATINPVALTACSGRYCQGAANAIINQVGAGNATFDPYGSLATQSAFQIAASQATPELTNENIQIIRLVTNSILDVAPVWKTLHGENSRSYRSSNIWVKPYGGSMNQNEVDTVDGFNSDVYGIVIGDDGKPKKDWLVGGAVATGGDNMDGKAQLSGASINSDTYQGMLYGVRKFPHHLYLAEQGLAGFGDNDTNRSIPLYSSTATGSYNSWFSDIRSVLGWNANVRQNWIMTPEFEANYLFVYQSAYQESGSAMDLSVNSNHNSSLVLGAYAHSVYHLTTLEDLRNIAFHVHAGLADNVLNDQPDTTALFTAGGPSFSTFGIPYNQVVFRGGVGLSFENRTKPFFASLDYDFQTGDNAFNNIGSVTLTYKLM